MGANASSHQRRLLEEARRRMLDIDLGNSPSNYINMARAMEILREHQCARSKRCPQKGNNRYERRTSRDKENNRQEQEAWVKEEQKLLQELALPIDDITKLFDLLDSDPDTFMRTANAVADMTPSDVIETTESTETRITTSPHDQQSERNKEDEDSKPEKTDLSTALSHLKEIIQSTWKTVSIKNRNDIVKEVMELYEKYPSTAMNKLRVKFDEENGLDFGGVTKDMLASFWTGASHLFFHGEDILVPYLNLEKIRKGDTDFRVLGRILSHTVALTGTLPFSMSVTSLISTFNGGLSCVSNADILLEEYLLFVSREERQLIEKALFHFTDLTEDETEFLQHLFDKHGHRCLPTKVNVKEKLTDIAAKVLIHDPTRYLQQMKEGMPDSHIEAFWSRLSESAFKQLVEDQAPTPEKVAEILTPTEELSLDESEIYSYLVNFVDRLDKQSLKRFLQYVTGYTRLPKEMIKISFNHELRGASRRPMAHTCSNQLDLPVHYKNYEDFVIEMTAILDNPLSMHMYME